MFVVDNEPNFLTAIAAVLRGKGFEVATARSGKDAILQITHHLQRVQFFEKRIILTASDNKDYVVEIIILSLLRFRRLP